MPKVQCIFLKTPICECEFCFASSADSHIHLLFFLILMQRLYLMLHFSLRPSEDTWLSQSRRLSIKIALFFNIYIIEIYMTYIALGKC